MARSRTFIIKSPIGGINKKTTFQDQPPYTSYDSLGFLPIDCKTGRRRVSTQPGWSQFGASSNFNLLSALNVAANSGGQETYERLLIGASGGTLTKMSITGTATTIGSGIDTGRYVEAATYGDRLFIANSTYKLYTYGGSTATWTASVAGMLPPRCTLICEFGGRIVLAGDPQNPHIVNMSRVDEPLDWLFAANDAGSPVSSTDLSGGTIQEPVVDLIPHNRSCLLTPSRSSFYIYRGNPTSGGILERLCYGIGITNAGAWCKTAPDDWTYFMSTDGLYRMAPGCGTTPVSVSREKIPDDLKSVDGVTVKAYLTYDVTYRGIIIGLTNGDWWWFDIETEGFSKLIGPGTATYGMIRFDPAQTSDKSAALVTTSTGLKRLDRTVAVSGSTYPYIWLSVSRLTPAPGDKAIVQQARPVFGSNTTDATGTLDFYSAQTAEEVVASPTDRHYQCTVQNCLDNSNVFPRVGGHALGVKYTAGLTSTYMSFEEMAVSTITTGRDR